MSLIALVVTLAVVGVLLWLLEKYVPMDAGFKKIIHIVVIVAVILWLLSVFGVLHSADSIRVPHT
jgi:hypothetical protein